MAFAAHQFKLSARQEDGAPLRDHLLASERASGKPHPMLADAPELPECLEPLWGDFLHLHHTRAPTMSGAAAISDVQIDAFQRVRRVRLEYWELAIIDAADRAYFEVKAEAE